MLMARNESAGENCPSMISVESKGHWGQVADTLRGSPVPPSLLPATATQRRAALAVSFFLLAVFFTTLPFARIGWVNFPGFVLIQKTLMLISDLITAALLFGQYSIGRARALNILAGGYLFTALIAVPHTLTFPQVFSETGLLAAGPQSAAWLYLAAHVMLPVTIIAFAVRREANHMIDDPAGAAVLSIAGTCLLAVGAVVAMSMIVTLGHRWLPPLMEGRYYTIEAHVVVGAALCFPLAALLMLARRRPPALLDLWLMVVMFAWLCTITLGAFVSKGRYDIGWYIGSLFDWLTSIFVLLMLISEVVWLYARQMRAAEVEHGDRERRIKEMEAVLIHLSRVSELGQNVSSLVHEVNQPLTAISNYLAAALQLIHGSNTERLTRVLRQSAEQAERAAAIIRNLRNFIARHEAERDAGNLYDVLQDAVRLALVGISAPALSIEIRPDPAAASALFDKVQIEQVVFNLVRNAMEAMENTDRCSLTIMTKSAPGNMVEVSIADTGPGLPIDIRAKLFEPFVTTKAGGLGVGLSICRVIIEAHGGRLQAADNPDGGTIFSFTLPQPSIADLPA
jgi:signal transduction histidine kinase